MWRMSHRHTGQPQNTQATHGGYDVSDAPFVGARPVDLSSDTDLTGLGIRGIYVGTGGSLKVDTLDITGAVTVATTGKTITAQDGAVIPFGCVTKVYSTSNGTTASGLWVGC